MTEDRRQPEQLQLDFLNQIVAPDGVDKKKGVAQYNFESDEEMQKLRDRYIPVCDEYLQWQMIQGSTNLGVKKYKESVYIGELDKNTNMRHGKGVIKYQSRRLYEGSWHQDKRHGLGFERFANGNTYKGEYSLGVVNGQGIYKWADGEEYEGLFSQGKKHGYGIWKSK